MSDYKMTKEQKLIQEIYDLNLQNNTARELDDAFMQGIDMAVGHLIELNLLRLHDVIGCSHPAVNNTTNKCVGCGKDWSKDLGRL